MFTKLISRDLVIMSIEKNKNIFLLSTFPESWACQEKRPRTEESTHGKLTKVQLLES